MQLEFDQILQELRNSTFQTENQLEFDIEGMGDQKNKSETVGDLFLNYTHTYNFMD
jgi:hypothetical protein